MSYESAKSQVAELVTKFEGLTPRDLQQYTEARTRQDFIEPLFLALGWNVHDSNEVAEEERVSRGRVDYAFRVRGIPRFFLEAKAIREDLNEPRWAVQAVTYAYNRGVPWAVLTDFEGLKVFNADRAERDILSTRFLDLTYRDYVEDFGKLWLLSKRSVSQSLLDKEAEKWGARRRRLPVGERLFSEFREWRKLLFKYLTLYNRGYTLAQLDEAIQRILDRLIFIRTCEDRGIEPPTLLTTLRGWQATGRRQDFWGLLKRHFRQFDQWYNSRLFQPHLADTLDCEGTPFERIVQQLYGAEGDPVRYDFSAIPVDVLGKVYEQYLGEVAQTARDAAAAGYLPGMEPQIIELIAKRTKRKAHGIYYTPAFVVNYIVQYTLGEMLKGLPYEKARRLRVLDMACGSGSFLIAAYDLLLQYHAEVLQQPSLTEEQRFEILTSQIFGIDLDPQAVEIAQLNLLLRTLETRTELPDLSDNIRCGNSLIEGGAEELTPYFGDAWREQHPFNWPEEFPEAMSDGGFDIIIGNPPYRFGETIPETERTYFRASYDLAVAQYDSYWLFYERGIKLLKDGGFHGFIVPDALLARDEPSVLRRLLIETGRLCKLAHVGTVFDDPAVSAVTVVFRKSNGNLDTHVVEVDRLDMDVEETINRVPQNRFLSDPLCVFAIETSPIWDAVAGKLASDSLPLGSLVNVSRGEELGKKNLSPITSPMPPEPVPILAGESVARFWVGSPRHVIDVCEIRKSQDIYKSPKLLVVKTGSRLVCGLDLHNQVTLQSLYNLQPKTDCPYDVRFLLGLLNSTLFSAHITKQVTAYKKVFPQINMSHIKALPIRRIDFDDSPDVARHDKMVRLVDEMLSLHERLAVLPEAPTHERAELEREIARTDQHIDTLVYELYELTDEEISVVEKGVQ